MTRKKKPRKKPAAQAVRRAAAAAVTDQLAALIAANFPQDARYYVLALDAGDLHLDREELLYCIKTDLLRRVQRLSPGMRYIYALQANAGGFAVHLLTDAPHAPVERAYSDFGLSGRKALVRTLKGAGAARIAAMMTTGIYGAFCAKVKHLYTASRNIQQAQTA